MVYDFSSYFSEPENLLKANDDCVSDHENGVDIENDDDFPIMCDMDGGDDPNDPNDMSRPRKIRR